MRCLPSAGDAPRQCSSLASADTSVWIRPSSQWCPRFSASASRRSQPWEQWIPFVTGASTTLTALPMCALARMAPALLLVAPRLRMPGHPLSRYRFSHPHSAPDNHVFISQYVRLRLAHAALSLQEASLDLAHSFAQTERYLEESTRLIDSSLARIDGPQLKVRAKELEILMRMARNSSVSLNEFRSDLCTAAAQIGLESGNLPTSRQSSPPLQAPSDER